MIRSIAAGAFALALAVPAALVIPSSPARAQDDTTRELINACVGCRLPKDLHGRDLHGLRFVGSDLRDSDLSHANLSGAEFTGADLDGTRFDDANLRNARFVGVHMRHTSFARAQTDGASFVGVTVSQDEAGPTAGRMILRNCTGCSLERLDLRDTDLRGIRVVGANLRGSVLAGSRLNGARLVGVNARGADLSRTDLRGADLVGASLRDARVTGATFGDATLCGHNRDGGRDTSTVVCADLAGVDLHGIDLRAVRTCRNGDDGSPECRTATRAELIDDAHADLAGALAPA